MHNVDEFGGEKVPNVYEFVMVNPSIQIDLLWMASGDEQVCPCSSFNELWSALELEFSRIFSSNPSLKYLDSLAAPISLYTYVRTHTAIAAASFVVKAMEMAQPA